MNQKESLINPHTGKPFTWVETEIHPTRLVAMRLFPDCVEIPERLHYDPRASFWLEMASYWHTRPNIFYTKSAIFDGVYGSVLAQRDMKTRKIIDYRVEVSVTTPNALRVQRQWRKDADNFTEAKKSMEALLCEAYIWDKEKVTATDGLTSTVHWKREKDGFVLSQVGMARFLMRILPEDEELQSFIETKYDGNTVCPFQEFERMAQILRRYNVYAQEVWQ